MNKLIFVISAILISKSVYTQTNIDSLYSNARELAFSQNYTTSRILCYQILEINPENTDTKLLLAKTYAWELKTDSAQFILDNILYSDSANYEAIDLSISNQLWAKNYDKALDFCKLGLKFYPEDENILLQKAKILIIQEQYAEAIKILEKILELNPDNEEARDLLNKIKYILAKNKISAYYSISIFDDSETKPWHLAYLQYLRKTKIGPVIARMSFGKRYEKYGWQYETEAYPKLSERNYMYLNFGYSPSVIFPRMRFGAEFYHSFPCDFETGIGYRYLIYELSGVSIFTGYLGKYLGNYWISSHTYITPYNLKMSVSEFLIVRKYFAEPENYLGFMVGYGISPDTRINLLINEYNPSLNSLICKLSYNFRFKTFWILNTGIAYTKEEFFTDKFRNIYTLEIELSRVF